MTVLFALTFKPYILDNIILNDWCKQIVAGDASSDFCVYHVSTVETNSMIRLGKSVACVLGANGAELHIHKQTAYVEYNNII